jgi:hypothetical protein
MKNLILAFTFALTASLHAQTAASSVNKPHVAVETEHGTAFLTWETQREVNTRSFTIERSEDGIVYTSIAVSQASGSSVFPKAYSYTDFDHSTPAYYRIQLMMMDGQTITSSPAQTGHSKPLIPARVEKALAGK